jgi:Mrp family chromosome partitioning ATPase
MSTERIKKAMELARAERERVQRDRITAEVADVEVSTALCPTPADPSVAFEPAPHATPSRPVAPARIIEPTLAAIDAALLLKPGMVGQAAHAFRLLRTQVLQRMRPRGWNSLAIVSATPEDGKTFTAINLAIAIAAHVDSGALLVDLDLRAPSVSRRLGFKPDVGIDDVLNGEVDANEAVGAVAGYEGLSVLPVRRPVVQSSELISSMRAKRIFDELKRTHAGQYLIFDLPPLLATDDALAFIPQTDAVLLVIGDGKTHKEDIARCMELLRNVPILGTVLNGSRTERSAEYAY